jgi:Ca2+-binding RTX toxin-like protein
MGGDDHITGNGTTRIDYNFALASVTVDIQAGTGHSTVNDDADVGDDTFSGVSYVRGSDFDDFLYGSASFDTFFGGTGDDTIDGRGNFDRMQYNLSANDPVTGGIAVNMSAGTVIGDASVGTDTLSSIESILGTSFADTYNAVGFRSDSGSNRGSAGVDGTGAAFNEFQGLSGNDIITGNGNTRIAFYNALDGVTVVLGNNGSSKGTAAGDIAGVGTDTLVSGVNSVVGSSFDDNFTGTNNAPGSSEIFEGRGGNDVVDGKGGYDLAVYNNDGSSGPITVTATSTTFVVTGTNVGTDTLTKVEAIRGTNLADSFDATGFLGSSTDLSYGTTANYNEFEGMGGNDTITGNGNTRLVYSSASGGVTVDLVAGTATGNASIGSDTFTGVNSVRATNFDDTILGTNVTEFVDTFFGGGGNDSIDGRGGYDIAFYSDAAGGITVDMAEGTVNGAWVGNDTLNAVEMIRASRFADTYDATGFSGNSTNAGSYGTFNAFEGLGGDDTITGNGNTRVDYSQAAAGVTVDLSAGTGHGTAAGDLAGVGSDTFTGGVNAVRGSAFDDTLLGRDNGSRFDNFTGEAGNDLINGRGGLDRVYYSSQANDNVTAGITVHMAAGTVVGDASVGSDTLRSVEGVRGTNFADTYDATGFSGSSTNAGSNGAFNEFEGLGGDDHITGNGSTRLAFYSAHASVTADISAGTAHSTVGDDAHIGTDTFTGVNDFAGSDFNDFFYGSANPSGTNEEFAGRAGDDFINGGGGFDRAYYNADQDISVGITVNMADGTVVGDATGTGTDTLRSVEGIRGTDLVDTYDATGFNGSSTNAGSNNGFNEIEGMGGDDLITGNGGTRVAYYRAEAGVTVDLVNGTAHGTDGGDVAHVGTDTFTGVNAVRGSEFADVIIGKSGGNVTLDGRGGNDTLTAGGGANTLIGGDGNDTFVFNTTKAANAIISDFAGNGASAGDHLEFNGFGTAAQGATFTFVSTSGGDSIWQIHSGLDSHNETITLTGITSAAGVHASDYLFV